MDFKDTDAVLVFELRCAATLTLLSLLEGCNDPNRPKLMVNAIDFASVQRILDSLWDLVKVSLIIPHQPPRPQSLGASLYERKMGGLSRGHEEGGLQGTHTTSPETCLRQQRIGFGDGEMCQRRHGTHPHARVPPPPLSKQH